MKSFLAWVKNNKVPKQATYNVYCNWRNALSFSPIDLYIKPSSHDANGGT